MRANSSIPLLESASTLTDAVRFLDRAQDNTSLLHRLIPAAKDSLRGAIIEYCGNLSRLCDELGIDLEAEFMRHLRERSLFDFDVVRGTHTAPSSVAAAAARLYEEQQLLAAEREQNSRSHRKRGGEGHDGQINDRSQGDGVADGYDDQKQWRGGSVTSSTAAQHGSVGGTAASPAGSPPGVGHRRGGSSTAAGAGGAPSTVRHEQSLLDRHREAISNSSFALPVADIATVAAARATASMLSSAARRPSGDANGGGLTSPGMSFVSLPNQQQQHHPHHHAHHQQQQQYAYQHHGIGTDGSMELFKSFALPSQSTILQEMSGVLPPSGSNVFAAFANSSENTLTTAGSGVASAQQLVNSSHHHAQQVAYLNSMYSNFGVARRTTPGYADYESGLETDAGSGNFRRDASDEHSQNSELRHSQLQAHQQRQQQAAESAGSSGMHNLNNNNNNSRSGSGGGGGGLQHQSSDLSRVSPNSSVAPSGLGHNGRHTAVPSQLLQQQQHNQSQSGPMISDAASDGSPYADSDNMNSSGHQHLQHRKQQQQQQQPRSSMVNNQPSSFNSQNNNSHPSPPLYVGPTRSNSLSETTTGANVSSISPDQRRLSGGSSGGVNMNSSGAGNGHSGLMVGPGPFGGFRSGTNTGMPSSVNQSVNQSHEEPSDLYMGSQDNSHANLGIAATATTTQSLLRANSHPQQMFHHHHQQQQHVVQQPRQPSPPPRIRGARQIESASPSQASNISTVGSRNPSQQQQQLNLQTSSGSSLVVPPNVNNNSNNHNPVMDDSLELSANVAQVQQQQHQIQLLQQQQRGNSRATMITPQQHQQSGSAIQSDGSAGSASAILDSPLMHAAERSATARPGQLAGSPHSNNSVNSNNNNNNNIVMGGGIVAANASANSSMRRASTGFSNNNNVVVTRSRGASAATVHSVGSNGSTHAPPANFLNGIVMADDLAGNETDDMLDSSQKETDLPSLSITELYPHMRESPRRKYRGLALLQMAKEARDQLRELL